MKRTHPDHPCNKPHIGEVYCLYGKENDWGHIEFIVIKLNSEVTIYNTKYHFNMDIVCQSTIDQIMLELGFILKNGGSIAYEGQEPVSLTEWQMNLTYTKSIDCQTSFSKGKIETLDFHVSPAFLSRFADRFPDIVLPYLKAADKHVDHVPLRYSPFVVQKSIQDRLSKIRRRILVKKPLSRTERYNLFRTVTEIFEEALTVLRDLVYPKLSEAQRNTYHSFETCPLDHFDELPTIHQVYKLTHISKNDLRKLLPERTGMTFEQFIRQRWVTEGARRLEANRGASVSNIAYELGWKNSAQFATIFKLYIGHSPTAHQLKSKAKKPQK